MRNLSIYLTLIFTFLLGCHKGFVALWTDADKNPEYVFPYSVASLPPEDQKKLEKGIVLDSEASLISLLEDYLS